MTDTLASLYSYSSVGGQAVRATDNKLITELLRDGEKSISIAAGHHTLTTTPLESAEINYALIRLTGAPGSARNVILPDGATGKRTFINNTTGGQTITVKTVSGTGVTLPVGATIEVYSDGTNVSYSSGAGIFPTAPLFGTSLEVTPSTNQNDYHPSGFDNAFFFKVTPGADIDITGLGGGVAGRFLLIYSSVTSYTVTLKHNDSGSTAANRFSIGADIVLKDGTMALLWYDALSSRWRCSLAGIALQSAASGTFTTMDSKTVTVENGVIVSIV